MIIDGKKLAQEIKENLIKEVSKLDVKPCLAVVLVGDNDASKIYVNNKKKTAEEIGITCKVYQMPEQSTQAEIEDLVKSLNADDGVNGIIVQLPLPVGLDSNEIIPLISPNKDVDGLGPYNAGLLHLDDKRAIVAATPQGVLYMLQSTGVELEGKTAVIIGRSNIVGRPMSSLLLNHDCSVTTIHSRTKNSQEIVKTADIVISACGQAKMVNKDWIKKGAVVIDVGINRENGKLCGDVDFESVSEVASFISPVPGGVGPMTVIMLMKNTYLAYLRQMKK